MKWKKFLFQGLDTREQQILVPDLNRSIRQTAHQGNHLLTLPGFHDPKCIAPVLNLLREAILNGAAEIKEQAAVGLADLSQLANENALKPHVVQITGPLIRVLGDRYPASVKTAILNSLAVLLEKVGHLMKAFLPQLQSTFLKALGDQSGRSVRMKAGAGLCHLLRLHPKFEQITLDLCQTGAQCSDRELRETYFITLRGVLEIRASDLSREACEKFTNYLVPLVEAKDSFVGPAFGVFLAQALQLPDAHWSELVETFMLSILALRFFLPILPFD